MINSIFITAFTAHFSFKGAAQLAHWNIVGSNFPQYHELFGRIYGILSGHTDVMAEQGRGIGVEIPASVFNSVPEIEWQDCRDLTIKLLAMNMSYVANLMILREECDKASNFGFVNVIEGFLTDTNNISYLLKSTLDQL